jgi:hypothetical protein
MAPSASGASPSSFCAELEPELEAGAARAEEEDAEAKEEEEAGVVGEPLPTVAITRGVEVAGLDDVGEPF